MQKNLTRYGYFALLLILCLPSECSTSEQPLEGKFLSQKTCTTMLTNTSLEYTTGSWSQWIHQCQKIFRLGFYSAILAHTPTALAQSSTYYANTFGQHNANTILNNAVTGGNSFPWSAGCLNSNTTFLRVESATSTNTLTNPASDCTIPTASLLIENTYTNPKEYAWISNQQDGSIRVTKRNSTGGSMWDKAIQSNTTGTTLHVYGATYDPFGNIFTVGQISPNNQGFIIYVNTAGTSVTGQQLSLPGQSTAHTISINPSLAELIGTNTNGNTQLMFITELSPTNNYRSSMKAYTLPGIDVSSRFTISTNYHNMGIPVSFFFMVGKTTSHGVGSSDGVLGVCGTETNQADCFGTEPTNARFIVAIGSSGRDQFSAVIPPPNSTDPLLALAPFFIGGTFNNTPALFKVHYRNQIPEFSISWGKNLPFGEGSITTMFLESNGDIRVMGEYTDLQGHQSSFSERVLDSSSSTNDCTLSISLSEVTQTFSINMLAPTQHTVTATDISNSLQINDLNTNELTFSWQENQHCSFPITKMPSITPTKHPSATPTKNPSNSPSRTPSNNPSKTPSLTPTNPPSTTPSKNPSATPSDGPTRTPSISPSTTSSPSVMPTTNPTVNQVPQRIGTIPDQRVFVGQYFEYPINKSAIFRDRDGEPLTLSAALIGGNQGLPQFVRFNNDKFVAANPQVSDIGSYTMIVTARDPKGATAEATFGMDVLPANSTAGSNTGGFQQTFLSPEGIGITVSVLTAVGGCFTAACKCGKLKFKCCGHAMQENCGLSCQENSKGKKYVLVTCCGCCGGKVIRKGSTFQHELKNGLELVEQEGRLTETERST